jgi:dihydropteroate synthase
MCIAQEQPMTEYFRAIPRNDIARPKGALALAAGPCWATEVEVLARNHAPRIVPINDVPTDVLAQITAPRPPVAGLSLDQPRIMGILNVTPDSFSSDGVFGAPEAALHSALTMVQLGADIIDIGGESTRPGAQTISDAEEIDRTGPVIAALRAKRDIPISIDTRKSAVARAALTAGATLVNDVSGFTFDPELAPVCARNNTPVCVMHAQGDPATMQKDPHYDDVLLDVYDFLVQQISTLMAQGVPKTHIIADPGIGFGKTLDHNLALLRRISLFHALGCPILLGASRKRFIGTVGNAPLASDRVPGSIAVGLAALAQGVQILRVHDVEMTKQAVRLYNATTSGGKNHD